jgi:hypothetical protein
MSDDTRKKIDEIFTQLSDLLHVPIDFKQVLEEEGIVVPAYDVNAIISKQLALFVYAGLNVPNSFAPPYNRVHADVEWWKQIFEKESKKAEQAPDVQSDQVPPVVGEGG